MIDSVARCPRRPGRRNVEGPLRGMPQEDRDGALASLLLSIERGIGAGGDWPDLTDSPSQ
ncbi:hypothetical protein [Nocardioides sp. Soil777]|uniref:hypothetical protein n=1 Tax=Nocardioides sp. Soil777 TaxID=1736409 RepID=UPI0012FC4CE2|nr:hypothetical protein [Nocardioides sp. Soil777]